MTNHVPFYWSVKKTKQRNDSTTKQCRCCLKVKLYYPVGNMHKLLGDKEVCVRGNTEGNATSRILRHISGKWRHCVSHALKHTGVHVSLQILIHIKLCFSFIRYIKHVDDIFSENVIYLRGLQVYSFLLCKTAKKVDMSRLFVAPKLTLISDSEAAMVSYF